MAQCGEHVNELNIFARRMNDRHADLPFKWCSGVTPQTSGKWTHFRPIVRVRSTGSIRDVYPCLSLGPDAATYAEANPAKRTAPPFAAASVPCRPGTRAWVTARRPAPARHPVPPAGLKTPLRPTGTERHSASFPFVGSASCVSPYPLAVPAVHVSRLCSRSRRRSL
jgi:hypothetical protein